MKLNLDIFEGPLDLLLYLIKKNNLEISKISLASVTGQYLIYLDSMKELNVDLASDFLFMAAELAHLKSQALLPRDEAVTPDEADDEAGRLVERLRIYQQFKNLAQALLKRKLLHRDVFTRGSFRFLEEEFFDEEAGLKPDPEFAVNTYELMRAFHEVLKRIPAERRNHHVTVERISVTARIYEILDVLKKSEHVLFTDLFVGHLEKMEFIVTFLAILEMAKLKMVSVFQTETFGPIRLKRKIEAIEGQVLDGAEEEIEDYK